jgi:hypothetical protein
MVVAVEHHRRGRGEAWGPAERQEQIEDAILNRLGVGPTQSGLQILSARPLLGRHGALAAQRTIGEVEDGPALCTDGEIEVEGEELGELEGLETVDDEGFVGRAVGEDLPMEEEAVSAGPCEVAHDSCMGDAEESSNLTQTRTFGGELSDGVEQVAAS